MNDAELGALERALASEDLATRVAALQTLRAAPVADPRVPALLEARLGDDAVAILARPTRIGELRALTVEALDATRRALAWPRTCLVQRRPRLTTTEIERLARARGLAVAADPVETYRALRDAGALPFDDVTV